MINMLSKTIPKTTIKLRKGPDIQHNKILKKKTLITQNLRIHCEITRESTQMSLVFHIKVNKRITKKKTKK